MTTERIKPAACRTMSEVRHGVDALDRTIVSLFVERFGYMDAAARIKQARNSVRDEARKQQVLGNVTRLATQGGIPAAVVAAVYEQLIEGSIAYELEQFDATRKIT